MTTPGNVASLADFAAKRGAHHGRGKWMDTLPVEVLAEVKSGSDSGLSGNVIAAWLKSIGYPEASGAKVDLWLKSQ